MATNVQTEKNSNESAASLLRRFTKRMQESGVLNRVRSLRYSERQLSKYKRKVATLEKLDRKEALAKLAKMGKLPPRGRK